MNYTLGCRARTAICLPQIRPRADKRPSCCRSWKLTRRLSQMSMPNCIMQSQGCEKDLDPYSYTSGGWIHQDRLQREARRIDFNFQELCARALAVCPGTTAIKNIQKLEGGFNRCFVLEMDNGIKVVAKIPTKLAGPPCLTTSSEVATMQLSICTVSQAVGLC